MRPHQELLLRKIWGLHSSMSEWGTSQPPIHEAPTMTWGGWGMGQREELRGLGVSAQDWFEGEGTVKDVKKTQQMGPER